MTTIAAADWPAPVWPAARLEASQAAVAREPNTLQGILGKIRLLANDGELQAARELLRGFVQAQQGCTIGSGALRQIIPIALLIHDQETVCQQLDAAFPVKHCVAFAVADGGNADDDVVSMQIIHKAVTFVLNASLFTHLPGEILIQRFVDTYPILACFLNSTESGDGAVAINLGDAGHTPGLAFCDGRPGYFMIPDAMFMDTHGYERMRTLIAAQAVPWDQRIPIAFWRGTTTGMPTDSKLGWRSLPRIRLCELASAHLDLIDAGLTRVIQINDPAAEAWIAGAGLLRPHVPAESFQRHRYQIDIDGNTTSWPGLFTKLLTGCPVLKVPPRDGLEQWYYDQLKPWVNFVPLDPTMADLPAKVRWLRANDTAAQRIGEAGRQLAEILTYEREIGRAVPVVKAAIADAAGAPVMALSFCIGADGVACLREGWHQPERSGVTASAPQSRFELPRPHGIGGFVLSLVVSASNVGPQRLSLALDGEIVAQRLIDRRTTLHVALPRRMLANKPVLSVTLLQPDARPAASPASPGDGRVLGVELHAASVWTIWRSYTGADPAFQEEARRLYALEHNDLALEIATAPLVAAPEAPPALLYTHHGTLAYVDTAAGCLRHGDPAAVPHNLFLAFISGTCMLLHADGPGRYRALALRPEGRLAAAADRAVLDQGGRARHFIPVADGHEFALQAAGMVLCAEPDGTLALSRVKIGVWERFRLVAVVRQDSAISE